MRSKDAAALSAARSVLRGRGGGRSGSASAYLLYTVILAAAIVVFPSIRAILELLARPSVAGAMASGVSVDAVCVSGLVLVAVAVLAGGVRGPIVPQPAFIHLLVDSPIRRSLALRGR